MNEVWTIEAELEGKRCEVAFFASWASYSHPVKPKEPLSLYQALMRRSYHRAWKCGENGQPRFVLFEAVENFVPHRPVRARHWTAPEPRLTFFRSDAHSGAAVADHARVQLAPGEALRQASFDVQGLDDAAAIHSVGQTITMSYRYRYRADGRLDSVTIVNPEGSERILRY